MKRTLSALLATFVVGAGLAGCAAQTSSGAQANPTQTTDAAHPVTVTVGVTAARKDYTPTLLKLTKAQHRPAQLEHLPAHPPPTPLLPQQVPAARESPRLKRTTRSRPRKGCAGRAPPTQGSPPGRANARSPSMAPSKSGPRVPCTRSA